MLNTGVSRVSVRKARRKTVKGKIEQPQSGEPGTGFLGDTCGRGKQGENVKPATNAH